MKFPPFFRTRLQFLSTHGGHYVLGDYVIRYELAEAIASECEDLSKMVGLMENSSDGTFHRPERPPSATRGAEMSF